MHESKCLYYKLFSDSYTLFSPIQGVTFSSPVILMLAQEQPVWNPELLRWGFEIMHLFVVKKNGVLVWIRSYFSRSDNIVIEKQKLMEDQFKVQYLEISSISAILKNTIQVNNSN